MNDFGRFLFVNGVEYPATFVGLTKDRDWGGRYSVLIHVRMTFEDAKELFVNNLNWSIKEVKPGIPTEEIPEPEPIINIYDCSDFKLSGDITDCRDNYVYVKMGKLTEVESLIQDIYGQVNSDDNGTVNDTVFGLSPRAQAFYNLYVRGMISIGAIRQAVMDGVLTQEEYEIITGQPYEA